MWCYFVVAEESLEVCRHKMRHKMSAFVHISLCHGLQIRSNLVCGAGAQDACVIALLKPPRLIHPSLLLVSSSHGGRSSGEIRCSSSSLWRREPVSTNASVESGEAQTIEQVWKEYFADPLQWWDNRVDKMHPKSPDFKHKVTKKALWVDGWSTPPWVKVALKLVTLSKLPSHVGYHSSDSQKIVQANRLPEGNFGRRNTLPTSARDPKQTVQVGRGSNRMQSAKTTSEAIDGLKNRLQQGIAIDSYMYVEVLKRCLKHEDLTAVKQVHGCVIESGMQQNIYVATNLLIVYIRYGRLEDARRLFDELVKKDVISWNVMIGGYAEHSRAKDAIELFNQMRQDGVQPSAVTYLSILKACASPSALKWGKEVHACIRHGGFESDVRVGTALLKMYAKCGSIEASRKTFDKLGSRNVISWNVMIGAYAESGFGEEAYGLLLQMIREGLKPDAFTYVSILNACASTGALGWVKEVHNQAREAGFELSLRVGTALVHMYAKCGSMDDARLVFDRMEERDVITWTVMIGGLAQHGFGGDAYDMFIRMQQEGCKANVYTYVSILNACASAGALEWVKEVHKHAREAGYELDLRVGNALVHMYAKCGSMDDARVVFDRMEERDVITWNVMIGGLAEHGFGVDAYDMFIRMQQVRLKPDTCTYVSILNACASAGALEWVKEVHKHAREAGCELDLRVGSALVHMYAKCGSMDDARAVFDRMEERDLITWTVMIGGLAEHGFGVDAYDMFIGMQQVGLKPDACTYVSILNACASAGALEWVKEVHKHALEAGFELDLRVGNALVHMYAKCGSMDDARVVFDRMEERDVITWNVMIGGLAQHGCGSEALDVFRRMIGAGVKADGYSFVALLSACSHAGLVDEGRRLFLAMSHDYGICPSVVHWSCMLDILGRAGQLEEARLLIDSMPVEPDVAVWGAFLGACRSYGNVEFGELAAKERVKWEPENASTYVLLSNIYAAAAKWEEVSLVRTMMQERGVRKEPGRSCIEVDNKIHAFVSGDTSHPETKEIYVELSRLTEKIKAEGYLPDTRLVLRDVDEKDKELSICSHSEKLAIACGLIRTPSSKPVRVFKNLRVCSDCHTATKLISKVSRREIVVRDANRFHHFKDGLCSCEDYW
ncbi:hypothetical protein M758_8G001900 [Ceratodon purpureus]|nr:hypothetical protein M758_8G001900 [Ceratodon purpureus]